MSEPSNVNVNSFTKLKGICLVVYIDGMCAGCVRSMRHVGRWWCILLVPLLNDIKCMMCMKCTLDQVVPFLLSFSCPVCHLMISQQDLAACQVYMVIWI